MCVKPSSNVAVTASLEVEMLDMRLPYCKVVSFSLFAEKAKERSKRTSLYIQSSRDQSSELLLAQSKAIRRRYFFHFVTRLSMEDWDGIFGVRDIIVDLRCQQQIVDLFW